MACSTVFDAFAIATESLSNEVYRNATYRSIWINLIPRGEFELGAGTTKTTFTIENSEPANDQETWKQITNDGNGLLRDGASQTATGGLCNNTYEEVGVGYSTKTYHPESFNLAGPIICAEDLLFDHNVDVFLRAYIEEMTKRSQRSWEKRYETLYMQFASKVAIGDGSNIVDAEGSVESTLTTAATSTLTQEFLDQIAVELIDRGATNPDSNGFISFGEDGPVFPLLVGLEASQHIALNNAELRNDFRHAESGNGATAELMSRLGATRSIKNFRHVPNLRPPRYDFVDGAYVRVPTYIIINAGQAGGPVKGSKSVLNPAYITAPYEAAIVMNPAVFTSEIVRPLSAAGGVSWSPNNYMGEWQWVTGGAKIGQTDCPDPLERLGRHYANFQHAPRPEFPAYGMTLIFKRFYAGSSLVGTNVTSS